LTRLRARERPCIQEERRDDEALPGAHRAADAVVAGATFTYSGTAFCG
jgi:hypothetical protein